MVMDKCFTYLAISECETQGSLSIAYMLSYQEGLRPGFLVHYS